MNERRTYSHLEPRLAPPSEYEIVTSRLHYYTSRGFEVDVPLGGWYERYQRGCPLGCSDWDAFVEPSETTYTVYTRRQRDRELALDRLFESIESADDEGRLDRAWLGTLGEAFVPLRFPLHGFQMIACYIGQMAPSGRITMASLFQASDELRRIERIARRAVRLDRAGASVGDGRRAWLESPAWQPLREVVERLLVTYDWGEAFVGLNVCLKPLFDETVTQCLVRAARENGDELHAELLENLALDGAWQRDWSAALARLVLAEGEANRGVLERWIAAWRSPATRAARAWLEIAGGTTESWPSIQAAHARYLAQAGLASDGGLAP